MRNMLVNVTFAAASLCVQPVVSALAQPPGGQQPQTGQPTRSDPSRPNDTMTRPQTTPGSNADITQQAPARVDDKKFLKDAAIGGMREVELGKLAAQNGSTDAVKQFGQKLVDDHGKANSNLKQIATSRSIDVPDSLDSKHQSRITKLSKLSGPEFDRAFIKDQVKDHQQDIKEFQAEAQAGSDPAVKAFASKTLPTLQEHLSAAKSLETSKSPKTTKGDTTADRSKQ